MDTQGDIITVDEAARLLGNVHPETIRRHLQDGRLPGRRIGRRWYLSRSQLEAFVRGELDAPKPRAKRKAKPKAAPVPPKPRKPRVPKPKAPKPTAPKADTIADLFTKSKPRMDVPRLKMNRAKGGRLSTEEADRIRAHADKHGCKASEVRLQWKGEGKG